jgi:hypothetical protein
VVRVYCKILSLERAGKTFRLALKLVGVSTYTEIISILETTISIQNVKIYAKMSGISLVSN